MYKLEIKDYNRFIGKEVQFKFIGWRTPVRALLVREGNYDTWRGERVRIVNSYGVTALFLEMPEDRCSYCSHLDDERWRANYDVYAICINKGKGDDI